MSTRKRSKRREDNDDISAADISKSKKSRYIDAGSSPTESTKNGADIPDDPEQLSSKLSPVCGIIKRIHLRNFLCHGNLDVKFDNNVSFVTGRNGSGKSAILAAIVLGLGGRPASLSRGNAARDYIKNGCSEADISITLSNAGPEAYQPNAYGDEIIITRKYTAAGGGKYQVKNAKGAVISEKRDEVKRIVDRFGIQLNNPVTFLTQDASRTFLHQCNPKKLYELFYRGTQLQLLDDELEQTVQNRDILVETIKSNKQHVKKLGSDLEDLEAQIEMHAKEQEHREQLASLSAELAWSRVRDAERRLNECKTQVESLKRRHQNAVDEIRDSKAGEQESVSKHDDHVKELGGLQVALDEIRTEIKHAVEQLEAADRDLQQKKGECGKIRREIVTLERDKENLESHIRDIEERTNYGPSKIRDQKEKELNSATAACNEMKAKLQSSQKEMDQLRTSLEVHQKRKEQLRYQHDRCSQDLRDAHSRLKDLTSARSNSYARFGHQTPRLIQLIDAAVKNGQLHRRPRGPLGAMISLTDDRWAVAVEACLGRMLHAYVCNDFHDCGVLEKLVEEAKLQFKPTTIVQKFGDENHSYDVTQNEVRSNWPTVLSVMKFDDNIARNVLIDYTHMETVLLFPDGQQLRNIMRNNAPLGCRTAYSMDGDQAFTYPTFRYYPSQNREQRARYLVKSVAAEAKYVQKQIGEKDTDLKRLRQEADEVQRHIDEDQRQIERYQIAVREYGQHSHSYGQRIRRLKTEIEDLRPVNLDTALLKCEIAENDRKVVEARDALERIKEAIEQQTRGLDSFKENINRLKQGENNAKTAVVSKQADLDKAIRHQVGIRNKIRDLERLLKSLDDEHNELDQTLTREQTMVEELTSQATMVREVKASSGRDCTVIEKQMRRLVAGINAFENQHGDPVKLASIRDKIQAQVNTLQGYLSKGEFTLKALNEAIRIRQAGYQTIKAVTTIMVKQRFSRNLRGRNYKGHLEINNKDQTLTIFVTTRVDAQNSKDISADAPSAKRTKGRTANPAKNQAQDLRGLSGGERSFATVAFVMALWESMDTPFCCMDEFDVFMDQYSRRVAMEMLILFALQSRPHHQFMFFTPLSVSELPLQQQGIRVLQLNAPRDLKREEKKAK